MRPRLRPCAILAFGWLLVGGPAGAATGLLGYAIPGELRDGLDPAEQRAIAAAIAAARPAAGSPRMALVEDLPLYTFFPQAGRPGRDLYLYNFTDLEPTAGVRDWDCSAYTYDGHQGHDSVLRTFREQDLGVPVFAALDGVVVAAHDGEPDRNTEWVTGRRSNHVVLDHGGGHLTYYLHFRTGSVAVAVGQAVAAGTQLGLTASSGFSSGPHLHFESQRDGAWYEPSAGPCRAGASQWLQQVPASRELAIADFYLTDQEIPCCTWPELAEDLDPHLRRAAFVRGFRRLQLRADINNLPGASSWRLRLFDPRGAVARDFGGAFGTSVFARAWIGVFGLEHVFTALGNWRIVLEINGVPLIDAPLRIVGNPRQAANRPPRAIKVALEPARPSAAQPVECLVETSPVHEDPDYDLLTYRYEWRANGKLLRQSTNAALSDVLARDQLRAGQKLQCRVTPADWRKPGPPATATARVE